MGGFTKLFSRILTSSIWSESNEVRIVWITLLAATGPDGTARVTLPGLSRLSNISLDETEKAVEVLSAPDRHSRTQEHDGRRIREERDNEGNLLGYFVYNYSKHRALDNTAAERMRRSRAKQALRRNRYARQKQKTEAEDIQQKTERTNESFAAPGRANPLLGNGDRPRLEGECLSLVRRLSELTGEEPTEVIARAAGYEGAKRTKVNPASMSDDRLILTVRDLRADVAAEEKKRDAAKH